MDEAEPSPDVVAEVPVAAVLDVLDAPEVSLPVGGGAETEQLEEPVLVPEPALPALELEPEVGVASEPVVPAGAEATLAEAPLSLAALTFVPGVAQPPVLLPALAPVLILETVLLVSPHALKVVVAAMPVDTEDA